MAELTKEMAWAYLRRAWKKRDGYWVKYWGQKYRDMTVYRELENRMKYWGMKP